MFKTAKEMAAFVLETVNPDFPNHVKPGDILVAGRNFGCSSGRALAAKAYGYPSGMTTDGATLDTDGAIISAEHSGRRVSRLTRDGNYSIVATEWNGKQLGRPNDVVVHPNDGSIWFTDPGYGAIVLYEGERSRDGATSRLPWMRPALRGSTKAHTPSLQ